MSIAHFSKLHWVSRNIIIHATCTKRDETYTNIPKTNSKKLEIKPLIHNVFIYKLKSFLNSCPYLCHEYLYPFVILRDCAFINLLCNYYKVSFLLSDALQRREILICRNKSYLRPICVLSIVIIRYNANVNVLFTYSV